MPTLGWPEILIILLVIIVLFGAAKLPELARSMGRSMRIFKSEMKEMKNENGDDKPAHKGGKGKKTEQLQAEPVVEADAVVVDDDTVAAETPAEPVVDSAKKAE